MAIKPPRKSTRPSPSESSSSRPAPEPHQWEVGEPSQGQRLDVFIRDRLGISRARLNEIFRTGAIRVNGRPAKKGQGVEAGQMIRVEWMVGERAVIPEPSAPLTVLYSDSVLVCIDKLAGIPSHPLRPDERGTLANALVARFPECAKASNDWREAGLCHRLDTETSGVLLAARDPETWRRARKAFAEKKVDKRYWALVTGPLAEQGEIELPLQHLGGTPSRVGPSLRGRPAQSLFRVLSRQGEFSLVEVQIVTGVLHQVRAHLAAIGAPIIGDELYGGRPMPELGRFFLHARSLELEHPAGRQRLIVESPLPSELVKALGILGIKSPSV